MTRGWTLLAAAALCAGIGCSGDEAPPPEAAGPNGAGREIHAGTGLVIAEDWELVAANCTGCHSTKQFLRQRGTAQTWQSIIDWMQETQGLWSFPDGVEERIVAYLAAHYGPGDTYRRAPIPLALMPPNPYASAIRAQVEDMRARGVLPTGPIEGK